MYVEPHLDDLVDEKKKLRKENLKEKLSKMHENLSICIIMIYRIS